MAGASGGVWSLVGALSDLRVQSAHLETLTQTIAHDVEHIGDRLDRHEESHRDGSGAVVPELSQDLAPMEEETLAPEIVDAGRPASATEHPDRERLAAACDRDNRGSCYSAASMTEQAGDAATALRLYARGCDLGSGPACNGAARLARGEDAVRFARRGCDLSYVGACLLAGSLLVESDPGEARQRFRTACDGGLREACSGLGAMLVRGDGGTRDVAGGAGLLERACEAGAAQACADLGYVLANDMGLPVDRPRALILYERACDSGVSGACRNAAFLASVVDRATQSPR